MICYQNFLFQRIFDYVLKWEYKIKGIKQKVFMNDDICEISFVCYRCEAEQVVHTYEHLTARCLDRCPCGSKEQGSGA